MKAILSALILTFSTSAFAAINCSGGTGVEARSIRELPNGGLEVFLGANSIVFPKSKVSVLEGESNGDIDTVVLMVKNQNATISTPDGSQDLLAVSVIFVYNPKTHQGLLTMLANSITLARNKLLPTCKK